MQKLSIHRPFVIQGGKGGGRPSSLPPIIASVTKRIPRYVHVVISLTSRRLRLKLLLAPAILIRSVLIYRSTIP